MITNEQFINIALEIAKSSKAERNKVGAILVKDNRVISTGYNGTIKGMTNKCEINNVTQDYVVHAEENAIVNAYKNGINNLSDCKLYVTLSPCIHCCKFIALVGITEVYYRYAYRVNIPSWASKLIKFIKV